MKPDPNDRTEAIPAAAVLAVNRIRNRPVPEDAVERALHRVLERTSARADNNLVRSAAFPQDTEQPLSQRSGIDSVAEASERRRSPDSVTAAEATNASGGQVAWSGRTFRTRFTKWVVALTVPILLVAAGWFAMRPRMAWADVVETVQSMPWMRLSAADGAGEVSVSWYSPTRQLMATRHGESATFISIADEERIEYDAANGTLCRLPLNDSATADTMMTVRNLIHAGSVESGSELFGFQVVQQDARTVDDGTTVWREFHLQLRRYSIAMTMVVRVEPRTKLPVWMEFTHSDSERSLTRRYDVDFPTDGPADIYALGVSRDLKLVDRIPATDLNVVLEKLSEGYHSFGDYSAVVCNERGLPWRLIRRRGDKWRFDRCVPGDRTQPLPQNPEQLMTLTNDDQWWRQRLGEFDLEPLLLCDGEFVYRFDDSDDTRSSVSPAVGAGTADRNSPEAETPAVTVRAAPQSGHGGPTKGRRGGRQSITAMADTYRLIVESFAYPPLRPSAEFELSLQTPPRDTGPPGTVLLEAKAVVPPDPSLMCRHWKLWLDPEKHYAVVKHEIIGFSDLDDAHDPYAHLDQTNQIREFDEFRQSPDGYHYPTVVRWKHVSEKSPDGPTTVPHHFTTYFHLDFATVVPESVFDPRAAVE